MLKNFKVVSNQEYANQFTGDVERKEAQALVDDIERFKALTVEEQFAELKEMFA